MALLKNYLIFENGTITQESSTQISQGLEAS